MPGLVRGVARTAVVAGTAATVSGRVRRRQNKKYAAQDQTNSQEQPTYQAPPPPAPAPAADPISQLKDLADLKQQGILTDEEFATQKARILSQ